MPFKYEYYSDDSEEQDRRQTKRRKLQHVHTTKATCLEDGDQVELVDALKDEVHKEDDISEIKAKYREDIDNARAKLRKSRLRTQRARKAIRDAGGAEFDSLLCVGDSLSYILTFLDIFSIGRCEKTCKAMKTASVPAWAFCDRQIIDRRYLSPFGDTIRDRTLRFCLASEYAKRAENEIGKHQVETYEEVCKEYTKPNECNYCVKLEADWQIRQKEDGTYDYDYSDEEKDDDVCCYPDKLNKDVINKPDTFDIFMRVSSQSTPGKPLFEGFIPQEQVRTITRKNGTIGLDINFKGMKFPNWPDMERSLFLDIQKDKTEWLRLTSSIPHITLLAMAKKLPDKIRSVESLSSSLMGCFGYCNCKEMDEFDDEFHDDWGDTVPTHYDGFGFEDDIYYVRVGSVTTRIPHYEGDCPCRYMYFLWNKDNTFAGLRIEDGYLPGEITGGYNPFY